VLKPKICKDNLNIRKILNVTGLDTKTGVLPCTLWSACQSNGQAVQTFNQPMYILSLKGLTVKPDNTMQCVNMTKVAKK